MTSDSLPNLSAQNRRAFRRMVVTLKANVQRLELLMAICDDRNLQALIIEAYEAELRQAEIAPFRARLDFKQPSLRASLEGLVAKEAVLQAGEPAVVTVLNAEALLGIRMGEEKSEQERFFFSLQWTREALLRFEFPVVLWVPQAVATQMGREAPDFWSWRGGVFEFAASAPLSHPEMAFDSAQATGQAMDRQTEEPVGTLSVAELQGQIAGLVETAPESSLLITLYNNLGEAYARKYKYIEAMAQYEKALELAKRRNNLAGQARSLRNLGSSLWRSGRSQQAIEYYKQSLEIARESSDRQGEAASLGNLGLAYYSLGQYQRAID
ncbi:MAG: tetratricopeptide repeat protein, partial [Phormidesmis sp.]